MPRAVRESAAPVTESPRSGFFAVAMILRPLPFGVAGFFAFQGGRFWQRRCKNGVFMPPKPAMRRGKRHFAPSAYRPFNPLVGSSSLPRPTTLERAALCGPFLLPWVGDLDSRSHEPRVHRLLGVEVRSLGFGGRRVVSEELVLAVEPDGRAPAPGARIEVNSENAG